MIRSTPLQLMVSLKVQEEIVVRHAGLALESKYCKFELFVRRLSSFNNISHTVKSQFTLSLKM